MNNSPSTATRPPRAKIKRTTSRSAHTTEYPLLRLSREHVFTLAAQLSTQSTAADALPSTGIEIADADPSSLAFFTGHLGLEPQKFLDWILCGTLAGLHASQRKEAP